MIDNRWNRPELRSSIPGIDWPRIPSPWAGVLLSVLAQLEESQWWPPDALLSYQKRQLQQLVHHAVTRVPYYGGDGGRGAAVGNAMGLIDTDAWQQLPLLTRAEVQDHYEALQSLEVPESHGSVSEVKTSGSTGRPVTAKTTRLAGTFAALSGLRTHHWHNRDLGGRLAMIHLDRDNQATYPDGLEQPGWGWPASEIYRTGPAAILSLRTPIAEQVEWLQRQRPTYLLSCPSNLLALAEHCIDHGIRLPGLRDIASIMEVVTPELRDACRAAWNVPVVDMYTTKEVGSIAIQCPDFDHYHVMAEDVVVEVLNDENEPCGPGDVGRVVVTPMHNFAMPLLRYELGDYAEVGDACPCGRGLPVLKRVLGRVRNMLILPDGQRYWPSISRRHLAETMPVKQHQLVQTGLNTLEFRLVADRPLNGREEDEIRRRLAERLPVPFDVVFSYVDRIERGAGGKFEDFYSELAR